MAKAKKKKPALNIERKVAVIDRAQDLHLQITNDLEKKVENLQTIQDANVQINQRQQNEIAALNEAICPRVAARLTALEKQDSLSIAREHNVFTRLGDVEESLVRGAKIDVNFEQRIEKLEQNIKMQYEENKFVFERIEDINKRLSQPAQPIALLTCTGTELADWIAKNRNEPFRKALIARMLGI